MKRLLLILGIVSLVASPAYGLDITDNLSLSGLVKNETALRLTEREERGDFMKVENTLQLGAEFRLMDNVHLFGLFRGFYEALYDIEDDLYDSEFRDEYKELRYPQEDEWVREAYIDLLFDWLDVRIGKQQVVWGTADGIKILDAVNPTDMREFTLDDYRDSRIPLWMVKTEFAPTISGTLQLLFIPDFEPNYIPPLGSPFTFRATAIGATNLAAWPFAISIKEEKPDPWENIDESSFGARWLDVIGGFEYTLNYLYGYYYSGANYSSITPPGTPGPDSILNLTKKYERIHLIGSSFSKALTTGLLAGLNIRGELAYIKGIPGYYGEDGDSKGVVKLDNYNYVLGLDKNLFTNWFLSFQFIQYISSISEHEGFGLLFGPTLGPIEQVETILSLKVSTDFMHERLKPEVLILYWLEKNWRISPKASFEIFDYLNLAAGAHIFAGDEQNLFGQFDDNDQVFIELRYGF
jgi:hypothetical protein